LANRLISEKIASFDFVPPFDFTASFIARRGEQTSLSVSKNLQNPVWWTIIENARTFLSKTPAAFRKISNHSGGAGRKGVEGEGNSRPALASRKNFAPN